MPDQIIDRDALIEKAKISIYNHVEDADWGNAYDAAAAALPVIVAEVQRLDRREHLGHDHRQN